MKFLGVECDRVREFTERATPGDGTMAAVFRCPACAREMALLTNPKYRRREGRRAHYTHGSAKLEIAWTVVPFIIVLGIAGVSPGLVELGEEPADEGEERA